MAARRGTLIHRLIERMPAVPRDEREDAARGWLARQAADFAPDQHEDMVRAACAVLDHPDWQGCSGRSRSPKCRWRRLSRGAWFRARSTAC
jgi:ATP-dependent helicase/nuclease subunit A